MNFLKWSIINGAMAALAYYGFAVGVEGAANVAMVMLWLAIVLSPVALSSTALEKLRNQPSWYKVTDTTFDILLTGFLLWMGLMWTGVFYLIHLIILSAARYSKEPVEE